MNANPETAWAEDRIGKLTRVLVPVCWGSITFFVLMAIAGILLIGKFSGLTVSVRSVAVVGFLFPLLYWSSLLVLMLRFFQSCRRGGAMTRKGISLLRMMVGIILFVALVDLLYTLFGAWWIAPVPPVVWTSILQQAAPSITNIILGMFLFLLSLVMEVALSLKEESELTI